jgi:hypothetical protein
LIDHHKKSVNKFTSDDRWFTAIGRFIFEFSQLEYELKVHIAEVIGLKGRYFKSIMTQDFAMLCTIAEAVLVEEKHEVVKLGPPPEWFTTERERVKKEFLGDRLKQKQDLKALIKQCRKLNEDRVRIVHGLWVIGGGSGKLCHVSTGSLTDHEHFHEASDLANKADQARHLRNELSRIF